MGTQVVAGVTKSRLAELENVKTSSPINQWVASLPQSHKTAIMKAVESGSLLQVRRSLRLIDELDPQYRGRSFKVEVLSTFNVEPILPVLQFGLNCIPSQAQIELGPLDDIEGHIARFSESSYGFDARLVV